MKRFSCRRSIYRRVCNLLPDFAFAPLAKQSPRHGVAHSHDPNGDKTPPTIRYLYRYFPRMLLRELVASLVTFFSALFDYQPITLRLFSRQHPSLLCPSSVSCPNLLRTLHSPPFVAGTQVGEGPSLKQKLGGSGLPNPTATTLTFVARFLSISSCRFATSNSFCRAPTLRALEALSSVSCACILTRSRCSTSSIWPISWRSCWEKSNTDR